MPVKVAFLATEYHSSLPSTPVDLHCGLGLS